MGKNIGIVKLDQIKKFQKNIYFMESVLHILQHFMMLTLLLKMFMWESNFSVFTKNQKTEKAPANWKSEWTTPVVPKASGNLLPLNQEIVEQAGMIWNVVFLLRI